MTYQERKEAARMQVIDLLQLASEMHLSYSDLVAMQQYFGRLAERYGLKREFRENGII